MNGTCSECRFMDDGREFDSQGNVIFASGVLTCHRYPPTTMGKNGIYPEVQRKGWCGEFLSRTARSKQSILKDFV